METPKTKFYFILLSGYLFPGFITLLRVMFLSQVNCVNSQIIKRTGHLLKQFVYVHPKEMKQFFLLCKFLIQ